jgi:small subunit ribosomal protein S1
MAVKNPSKSTSVKSKSLKKSKESTTDKENKVKETKKTSTKKSTKSKETKKPNVKEISKVKEVKKTKIVSKQNDQKKPNIKKKSDKKKKSTKPLSKKVLESKKPTSLSKKNIKSKEKNDLTKKELLSKSNNKGIEVFKDETNKSQSEFLNKFDWQNYEEGIEAISEKKLIEFENLVKENFVDTSDDDVIEGEVVYMTDREAIIDINAKSEGVISLNEFRYNPDLKLGDKVEVIVDSREDKTGQLVLSHRKARVIKAWDRVNSAHDTGEVVNGFVKCKTKGGMIVDVFGIEAFLPGSQIDVKPIRDYDQYVNKNMEFKVVKINHEFKNIVVSHKALIEADIEEQKKEIIGQLEKGQVLEGTVKNITSYGVFIDLGGVDGLIHITDLSWSRINNPNDLLELDQKLNVVILDFDDNKSRIQLGLKQLSSHPWENLSDNVKEGEKVKGKVVVIADYGAFIEIEDGVEGLVHVSEMSWSTHLRSAQDFVSVGDEVEAVVLTLDRESRKMSLGFKQMTKDPWIDISKKYPVASKHKGIVRNFTNFGVFIELEEGIDGLAYISDLSWTKKIKHPSEILSVNDSIDVVVLELDINGRKLSLGHKQTFPNPWDKYEKEFSLDSIHSSKISDIVDKGAIVKFNEDVVGFVPSRFLEKVDGSKLKKGDTAEFKIIEFNKEFKRVVVSHTSVFRDKEKKNFKNSTKKNTSSNSEKTTLGDLDALAGLKEKMDKK